MSWWHSPTHPAWTIAQVVTVTCAALALGYLNASHFDSGELRTALGTGLAALIATRFRKGTAS